MSNFKSGSRFSRGNGGGSKSSGQQSSGGQSNNRSSGGNGGGGKKYKFTRIGSMTVPKTISDELRDMILSELRGSDIKLNVKIYPPKNVESVTLNRDDILVLSFGVNDQDKDFVVGHALIPNGE
jgi:hypothetical protein